MGFEPEEVRPECAERTEERRRNAMTTPKGRGPQARVILPAEGNAKRCPELSTKFLRGCSSPERRPAG